MWSPLGKPRREACAVGARQEHRRGPPPRCRAVPGTGFSLQVWEAESWCTCGTEGACLGLMCGVLGP